MLFAHSGPEKRGPRDCLHFLSFCQLHSQGRYSYLVAPLISGFNREVFTSNENLIAQIRFFLLIQHFQLQVRTSRFSAMRPAHR